MRKAIVLSRVSTLQQDLRQQTEEILREVYKDGYKKEEVIVINLNLKMVHLAWFDHAEGGAILKKIIILFEPKNLPQKFFIQKKNRFFALVKLVNQIGKPWNKQRIN